MEEPFWLLLTMQIESSIRYIQLCAPEVSWINVNSCDVYLVETVDVTPYVKKAFRFLFENCPDKFELVYAEINQLTHSKIEFYTLVTGRYLHNFVYIRPLMDGLPFF